MPLAREFGHYAGKSDGFDLAKVEAGHAKVALKAHVDLVGREGAIGGHAPGVDKAVSVKQAEGGLRVSHIHS